MINKFRKIVTDVTSIIAAVNELIADHATFKTVVDDIKTLVNDIRTKLTAYISGGLLTSPVLTQGSTPANVATSLFFYTIGGIAYSKAAVAAGTAPGNDVIPQNKYGAVALDIGADGTIDVVEATDNATGFNSAALAVAALPAVAANHVRMGTVTAMKSDGTFTFGTTSLSASNTTVAYTDGTTALAALGSAVSSSSPATLAATTISQQGVSW